MAVCWLSPVAASKGYSLLRCAGFSLGGCSCCGAEALGARESGAGAIGSVVVACGT